MLIRTALLTALLLLPASAALDLPTETYIAAQPVVEGPPAASQAVTEQESTLDPAGIRGADAEMEEQILEAMELYAEAGLELPPLRIYVHDNNEPCLGHMGLFGKDGDTQRIDICEWDQRVVVHELAHAWERHSVDEASRQDYLALTGLEVWNDHSVAHPARGIESAAEAIKWGLLGGPVQRMSLAHHGEDLERYELLTGVPSPRIAHLDEASTQSAPARRTIGVTEGASEMNAQ